jgi:hypothetical protein
MPRVEPFIGKIPGHGGFFFTETGKTSASATYYDDPVGQINCSKSKRRL